MADSRYQLLEQIGEGGMATVHRARQTWAQGFERIVAIKQICQRYAAEPGARECFVREATIGAVLTHANIVQVHDFVEAGSDYFLAMEYVDGQSLGEIVRAAFMAKRMVSLDVVLSILRELCDALAYAHDRGVVHRDVSLENVLVTRTGHVKLADFGIAIAPRLGVEPSDERVGKMSYMAPETIRHAASDHRIDLFAFGIVAWELLCARALFRGSTEGETARNVLRMRIEPPSRVRSDCPRELDELVMWALARSPGRRPASAAEIADALDAIIERHGVTATPIRVARWIAAPAARAVATTIATTPLKGLRLAPSLARITSIGLAAIAAGVLLAIAT